MTYRESEFLTHIQVLDTKYGYPKSINNNFFYHFNNQLNYILAHYFVESKTMKCNVNEFYVIH